MNQKKNKQIGVINTQEELEAEIASRICPKCGAPTERGLYDDLSDRGYETCTNTHCNWMKWLSDKPQPCLHEGCPECGGTGRKKNGEMCVHHLSCPCPKCTPRY